VVARKRKGAKGGVMMKWIKNNRGCLSLFLLLLATVNLLLVIFAQMPYWLSLSSSVFIVIICAVWALYCGRIDK
jgi:membrane protein YdbS with pleckstrin-like domain